MAAFVTLALGAPPWEAARAIESHLYKDIRGRYEGLVLRLRIDLNQMTGARAPNVISLGGVGHGREGAPILFGRMERVYIERVTNEGGTRLELTIYRTQQEANRFRASAVPQPSIVNPNYGQTLASFAQLGSTSVLFELEAGKKDPGAQEREIEELLDRVFYVSSEPPREEMETFVRQHRGLPIQRLRELTDLDSATIRRLIEEAAPGPDRPPEASGASGATAAPTVAPPPATSP